MGRMDQTVYDKGAKMSWELVLCLAFIFIVIQVVSLILLWRTIFEYLCGLKAVMRRDMWDIEFKLNELIKKAPCKGSGSVDEAGINQSTRTGSVEKTDDLASKTWACDKGYKVGSTKATWISLK